MTRHILLLVMVPLLTVSCGRQPGVYAVPAQLSLNLGRDPGGPQAFVRMDDPEVEAYLVHDVSPERGIRRWVFARPELRFTVQDVRNLKFTAEFDIPDVTYKVTGPVTVSCAVNGRSLGSIRCEHAGRFRLEKPVPNGLVEPDKLVSVTFEAHPRWIYPDDGTQLSFLLRSAGFTH